jgi:hypothetical protein
MSAAELALAKVDVTIVERRTSQGSRAGGLHARAIEVLDQRGIADRFLSAGQVAQVAGFAGVSVIHNPSCSCGPGGKMSPGGTTKSVRPARKAPTATSRASHCSTSA